MFKFISFSGFFLFTNLLFSQLPSFDWVKTMGGTNSESPNCTKLDKYDNIYSTGGFSGTPDFDPGMDTAFLRCTTNNGTADIFVSKLNASGNYVWARSVGGTNSDAGNSLTIDTAENVYVVGTFEGTVDFNPGNSIYNLTSAGGKDIFILKLNKAGNFVWAKRIGYLVDDNAGAIEIDAANNIYITGSYNGTVDFDPGNSVFNLTSSGRTSYVLKLTSGGNFIWAKSVGSGKGDFAVDLTLDDSCNVYATGSYAANGDFDPGSGVYTLNNSGSLDAYVLKLDSAGNFVWARGFGGTAADNGRALKIDLAGNIYNSGYFAGNADFDPGSSSFNLQSNGLFDTYVLKLNPNGNLIWAKSFGGSSDDKVSEIISDNKSDLYLIGSFIGKADFDPGKDTFSRACIGLSDAFISKFDSSGNFKWVRTIGGTSGDGGSSILLDSGNNILTAGSFSGTVDFNQNGGVYNLTAKGGGDIFIHRMKQSVCYNTFSTQNVTACIKYTSPSGKYTWTQTNTYNDTIANYLGGDSIISLKLKIGKPSSYFVSLNICDSIKFNGITYSKNGVYNQILMNKVGCDSTLTLNITVRKSSANVVNFKSCDSFSLNNITYKQSGSFTQTLKNRLGCDSTITLNLTIVQSTAGSITQRDCKTFVYNGKTYTKSGVYFQNFKNAAGCDSTLSINIRIDTLIGTVSIKGKSLMAKDSNIIYQWIDCTNNTPIAGEISRIFTPATPGNYAVILKNGTCSDTSDCVQLSNTGFHNIKTNSFSLYPNPSDGIIYLAFLNRPENTRLEVYSNNGRLIYKSGLYFDINTLDFTAYSKGLYVLKVIDDYSIVTSIIELQ